MAKGKVYAAIDLKSFYASVECVERGLNPLDACLVVADQSRTDKTICLAVSPALKARGVPGRPRLFEVIRQVGEINADRRAMAPGRHFQGESASDRVLKADPSQKLTYITAMPRMALYMEYSVRVYGVYLRFLAPEDIHVYSVDEVLLDLTPYLETYGLTRKLVQAVLQETGITATAGIGTNLYLCKVAMDIVAKHLPAGKDGVRIAALTEESYREKLWEHRPLTDFWRIGPGIARKLAQYGMYTLGDVARMSLVDEDLLYRLFGVNGELLIDHAWGWEPCTLEDIKKYTPQSSSLGSGQVLQHAYTAEQAGLIVWEMADQLALDLVRKGLVTDRLVLHLGYDRSNLEDPERLRSYRGRVAQDHYGRLVPFPARGTQALLQYTASGQVLTQEALALYRKIVDPQLLLRKVSLTAERVLPVSQERSRPQEADLFAQEESAWQDPFKEYRLQETVLALKERIGKNSILKGNNLCACGMTIERNQQVGGHRA